MNSYFARTYLNYSKLLLVYPSTTQRRLLASPPLLSRSKNSALGVTPSWCMRAMDESTPPSLVCQQRFERELKSFASLLVFVQAFKDCDASLVRLRLSKQQGISSPGNWRTWGDQGLTIVSLLHCQGGHRIIQLRVGFNISVGGKKACSICIHIYANFAKDKQFWRTISP